MKDNFVNAACPTGCQTRNNWLGTVRGRVGYACDRVMPYVTGGLAVGDIEANQGGFAGVHDTKAGWAAGAGVEAAIAGNWTAKLEYLHVDLGSIDCNTGCCAPDRVGFHCRYRPRRRELALLIAHSDNAKSPGGKPSGAFFVVELCWTIFV